MMQMTQPGKRGALSAIALLMAFMLTVSSTTQGAWAATTGADYSAGRISVSYGTGDVVEGGWSEGVLTVDDEWVYCADVDSHFAAGLNVSREDPVASGRWSQDMVTELALASDFVWTGKFKTSAINGDGHVATSNREKYAVTQVLVWEILNNYGYSSYGWFGAAIDGIGLTGSDDGHADCWAYINANRNAVVGHANYYDAGSAQSMVCGFWTEPAYGGFSLAKVSADPSVTKGNAHYSLEGAVYGVFATKADAKTHEKGKASKTYRTDGNGKFETALELAAGTYYVAETKAPEGYALDESVYEVKIEAGKTVAVNGGTVKDEPLLGGIELVKRSANASISKSNGCYSLKGAVYGVFDTRKKGKAHDAGEALRTFKTDEDGKWSSGKVLAAGTYYVAETKAPEGYALDESVYEVEVPAGSSVRANADVGYVADEPKSNPVTLWVAKSDAETADGSAQGSASLAGAQFEIAYYDGYYELATLPGTATRTWVVTCGDDGKAYARDDLKVSGDDFYRTDSGAITIPLGTVVVREVQAPEKYLLGNGTDEAGGAQLIRIESSDEGKVVGAYIAPGFTDHVMRGGVMVGKVDRQNGEYVPQGAATLAGASFSIVSSNARHVIVDGNAYADGEVVKTIETELVEGRYVASTDDDCLPVGRYVLYENATSAEGYLYDDVSRAWSRSFEVSEDGQMIDLADPNDAVGNQVVRGDFSFSKIDGQTGGRLALVPFMVTSLATGEAHVVMTDENGMLSTSSSWNAHTERTNANDDAVSADDAGGWNVDESKLDAKAGIWFSGSLSATCAPDDALGALPYDTYAVSELRSSANEGYELAEFTVTVSRHARELDLGTVDDNAGPLIATTLRDAHGEKIAAAGSVVTLVDAVRYENLDVRETYTLEGSMHLVTEEGADGGEVANGMTSFQPSATSGSADVKFAIDTSDLGGMRLVAFERLLNDSGVEIAAHEDLSDEGQTMHVPDIATSLADGVDGSRESSACGEVTLVDTVTYRGLAPGVAYTLRGTLHVRDDAGANAGPALDELGREIATSQPFVAEASEGETRVSFTFKPSGLAGAHVVAFEELLRGDIAYASHADINDEGQTVRIPAIETTLVDGTDGDHATTADETIMLVDTVTYRGLTAGEPYILTGTLHIRGNDGVDGGVALDSYGNEIAAVQEFTPETESGEVDVVFAFSAPNLAGATVVAFEELSRNGRTYAVHADIDDGEQTMRFSPPRTETGEPPDEEPPDEKEPPGEEPDTPKTALPRTGDEVDPTPLALTAAATIGLIVAILCARAIRRSRKTRMR